MFNRFKKKKTIRDKDELLTVSTLMEAYSILCRLVDMGAIQKDPNKQFSILVYKNDGPEGNGFYGQNIFSAANVLFYDFIAVDYLFRLIRKYDPSFVPEKPPKNSFTKWVKRKFHVEWISPDRPDTIKFDIIWSKSVGNF